MAVNPAEVCDLEVVIGRGGPCLRLRDRNTGGVRREWRGLVASHVLTAGILPERCCRAGRHRCDKALIWHLILAAAAASLVVGEVCGERRRHRPAAS